MVVLEIHPLERARTLSFLIIPASVKGFTCEEYHSTIWRCSRKPVKFVDVCLLHPSKDTQWNSVNC